MSNQKGYSDDILNNARLNIPRGHLKIFFGYASGVGKTFSMIKAALAAKHRGVDVVVGYIDSHSKMQTMQLVNGLECLPPKTMERDGKVFHEFDLDTAVDRMPKLIVVDELAHTNAPTCRHLKRYQDIEELLKAGIDVYTTVNVQHIESLNDIVASIIGKTISERIPDNIFDNASQVELVDIEPQDLLDRLHNSKIYDKSTELNDANLFNLENLAALREIALRRCADRVNIMSEKVRMTQGSDYHTDEHILVCLSSSPTNAKIIRTAARMASAFRGRFTALFVETSDFSVMTDDDKNRLRNNVHLAQQLGATIETVCGDDIALQIAEFARISGVSKIVVGRSNTKRQFFSMKSSFMDRLSTATPNLDIYIIPDKETPLYDHRKFHTTDLRLSMPDLLKSIALLCAATAIGGVFYLLGFSEANIITVYILSVLITAIVTSYRIYSLIYSIASVLVFNYFFTIPRFTFKAYDPGYPVTFLIMFLAAFITSTLAVKIKQHARQSAETAFRTKILLETNQLLQRENTKAGIIQVTANQLTKLLQKDIIFYTVEADELNNPQLFSDSGQTSEQDYFTEKEKAVATWVLKNNKHAGATTDTLSNAKCLYLAVRVNELVFGVVGIALDSQSLDSFENNVVLSILGECALALQNEKAIREREQAAVHAKNEQLRANLLRSISHDLRTPLTSISGNAGILLSNDGSFESNKRKELYTSIYDDSLWLINLVENLLAVTRIEDDKMHLNMNAELVEEVIQEAMQHIDRHSVEHHITISQTEDFLIANMDARLIVQVIINIVDNAIKYTPTGSNITIATSKRDGKVYVEVADDGQGLTDEVKERVFDMFYTANAKIADSRRSLGLGLSLCKSIINAHGGEITVRDNKPQGAVFCFTLPAKEVRIHE